MDIDSDTESEIFSLASGPSASVSGSVASSLTSYEVDRSMRSASPVSVVSVTESMQAQIYRQEYGRGLNNYSDVYRLPADEEELDRLGLFPRISQVWTVSNLTPLRQTAFNVRGSYGRQVCPAYGICHGG